MSICNYCGRSNDAGMQRNKESDYGSELLSKGRHNNNYYYENN